MFIAVKPDIEVYRFLLADLVDDAAPRFLLWARSGFVDVQNQDLLDLSTVSSVMFPQITMETPLGGNWIYGFP